MNIEESIAEARQAVELGIDAFRRRFREALAYFPADVGEALLAHIRLEMQAEHAEGDILDLKHHMLFVTRAFVTLLDRGVIKPSSPLSPLAAAAIGDMRKLVDIYPAGQEPKPTPRQLTAQEQLDADVISDFRRLPSKDFRALLNSSRAYKEAFRRLGEEDRLGSGFTTA